MKFFAGPKMAPGRVVVKKDGQQVAVASSTAMLRVIENALLVGDETHTHPETMWHVRMFIVGLERECQRQQNAERNLRRRNRSRSKAQ